MTHRYLQALGLFTLITLAIACGAAEIGEECDKAGSRDECVDGAVCTNESDGARCRRICEDDMECSATQSCNGVSGSNIKSCQPKAK